MFASDKELECCGLRCPLPLLKAKQAIAALESGQVLKVIATDPGSVRDFQSWAALSGHSLLASDEQDGCFIHTLRKA